MGDCARCTKPTNRLALDGIEWVCAGCAAPMACRTCGRPARPIGVERFAIGSMDTDAYRLPQSIVYRCEVDDEQHRSFSSKLTWGPEHRGPGWQPSRFVKDPS